MPDFQQEPAFQCPYCASWISVLIDLTAGREQVFTTDCEVCCRPIAMIVTVDDEGAVSVQAERELS